MPPPSYSLWSIRNSVKMATLMTLHARISPDVLYYAQTKSSSSSHESQTVLRPSQKLKKPQQSSLHNCHAEQEK